MPIDVTCDNCEAKLVVDEQVTRGFHVTIKSEEPDE